MTCSVIVTDLTPYGRGGLLYVTGVDMATGRNVRPLPYLSERACVAKGILPGAVLEMEGDFYGEPPFAEDFFTERLISVTPASGVALKKALGLACRASLAREFQTTIYDNRYIRQDQGVQRSLATTRCQRNKVKLTPDNRATHPHIIRIIFQNEREWFNIPLMQWIWYRASLKNRADAINELQAYLLRYEQLFMRIGLARAENGIYNLQVNGIYGV
ncbi:MAG: hypothetical protein MSH25_09665 [Desulfovibrio sp.]|uniref:hypothetical protein n=1 Tax=Desulfovibrio sp. TaxID=885 RepID=UPI0025C37EDD|nr:hypothetical protein [Desulfovibrio sp.]MCI7569606.1 hypothetical protein [Desulfovibrio sp.]